MSSQFDLGSTSKTLNIFLVIWPSISIHIIGLHAFKNSRATGHFNFLRLWNIFRCTPRISLNLILWVYDIRQISWSIVTFHTFLELNQWNLKTYFSILNSFFKEHTAWWQKFQPQAYVGTLLIHLKWLAKLLHTLNVMVTLKV